MRKDPNFTGQPIFSQLIKLIDRHKVKRIARASKSDRYCKRFDTYHHLISMLYAVFHRCSSLREVVTGLQACHTKLHHLGLDYSVRRSTFSDANIRRKAEVFEAIYFSVYKKCRRFLPDSRTSKSLLHRLYIADSTTITLFQEILKNAGRTPANGKRKGGLKVHTLIRASEDVPCLIKMNAAASHDVTFIKGLSLPTGSIIVFDKGYVNYAQYKLWNQQKVTWVTRMRKGAVYETLKNKAVKKEHQIKGVLSDDQIILGHSTHEHITRTQGRLIRYYDEEKNREFNFITNNMRMSPLTICMIYRNRWQIELLFKRLKQAYPLEYFLGDNENAIKVQVWCVLIADLLIQWIKATLKRAWSYSNIVSMIRIHLMTYIDIRRFLNDPDKSLLQHQPVSTRGPTLFDM